MLRQYNVMADAEPTMLTSDVKKVVLELLMTLQKCGLRWGCKKICGGAPYAVGNAKVTIALEILPRFVKLE